LPPVAYDSFFRILNHTQQNVVATSSNPEFAVEVFKSIFNGNATCNIAVCSKENVDGKMLLRQQTWFEAINGDLFDHLVEMGRKFVKLDAKRDS